MSGTTANAGSLRDVVRIGQVWEHHGPQFSIRIKQIHRADHLVEAWFNTPNGLQAQGVTFADLRRDYELVA